MCSLRPRGSVFIDVASPSAYRHAGAQDGVTGLWRISEISPGGSLSLRWPPDLASVCLSEPQKEEVGEALHDVDFQQLKIENAQFLETIEARNKELIQLKLASGNTLQVLNTYKVSSAPEPGGSQPPAQPGEDPVNASSSARL